MFISQLSSLYAKLSSFHIYRTERILCNKAKENIHPKIYEQSVKMLILVFLNQLVLPNPEGVEPGQHNTPLSPEGFLDGNIARRRLLLLLLPLVWEWNGKLLECFIMQW